MNITKILKVSSTVMVIMLMLNACGRNNSVTNFSEEAQKICGSWAYNHDKTTEVAVFHKDGTAQYEGKDYTFECDEQFVQLKGADEETKKLRYVLDKEGMLLYSSNTYTFDGEGEPDGLPGKWTCADKNWSFQFSREGTFMEDGYFPGYYSVDDKESTITLVYTDHFEDTVCYYQLTENKLTIEYPWRMVPTEAK